MIVSMKSIYKKIFKSTNSWIILIALFIAVLLSIMSPVFLSVTNFQNILKQVSITALIAAGMTLVIISGGIDLSVGSIVALSGVAIATSIRSGVPEILGIGLGIGVGTFIGILNGIIISLGNLPPFIATLGMMGMARGLALVITKAESFAVVTPLIMKIGTTKLFGLPISIVIVGIVYILFSYILNQMRFGRYVYVIGGNEEAARLSGINVVKQKIKIYALSGAVSALAAVIMVGRLYSAPPTSASGAELDAIAAVIIGGTSFSGGIGTISGTLIGALIMSILANGFNLMNISSFWQQFFIGAIIIFSVWIDNLRHNK